jgi:hypothetical protein
MTFPHKNFLGMSENAMLTILAQQNTPKPTIKQIIESVRNEKKRLRSEGARRTQYKRLWSELLEPLEYEIRLVERMYIYPSSVQARTSALYGYQVVLEKVRKRILKHEYLAEHTPSEIAKDKRYPNNGVHWSDWIPQEIKEAVIEAFGEIPRAGIKVKVPFERKIPATLHIKLKKRLRDRTQKEYDLEWRKNTTDYTDERAARIKQMKQAMEWIDALVDGEAMPTTWHGFYR